MGAYSCTEREVLFGRLAQEEVATEESVTKRCSGGKLVKVAVRAHGGAIEHVRITGDFFTHPEGVVEALERKLVGMRRGEIGKAVEEGLGEGTLVIGFYPGELIIMIEECLR